MGKRGPQPGAKAAREAAAREAAAKAAAEGAETPLSSMPAAVPAIPPSPSTVLAGVAELGTPDGARWLLKSDGSFEASNVTVAADFVLKGAPPEEQGAEGEEDDTGFTPMDGDFVAPLSAADRENPERLSGDALRALAHRRGIARSALAGVSDERIRTELRYITHRQYSEEGIA